MRKNLYIHFGLYYFLCIFMCSCSMNTDEMKTAERLMEIFPDSALHILQQINTHTLYHSSDKASYALLMSQALDKNDIKVESDSLISIATNYYAADNPQQAAYAWFYMARCAYNQGNVKDQANALLKAQEFAERTENDKLLGLVYGDKGMMYKAQNQTDSSIYYFKLANKSFEKIKDYRNIIIDLLNIGTEYLKTSRFDSALHQYLLAEKLNEHCKDTLLSSTIYRSLGSLYLKKNYIQFSIYYYNKVPNTYTEIYNSNKYFLLANVYIRTGNTDSVRYYLNKVIELQEMAPDYYSLWQTVYEKEGNLIKALYYAKLVKEATDSLYKRKLDISFAGLERKYKYQSLQISNQNLTIRNKQNDTWLLIALLILSVFSIFVLFWRIRANKQQLETQKQLVLQEKALVEKEKEKVEQEKENSALLEKQLKMHKILLYNIEQYRKNSIKRPESATTENKSLKNPTFYQELITCMDVQYNDISSRLHNYFPQLTERDILICCLLLASFDTGSIATILSIDNDSINKQRYRIRLKLGLHTSSNLIDFLRHF